MSQVGKQAMLLDAMPVVQNATDRDTKYPSPDTNFRVHNLATGYVEQYDGANWNAVFSSEKGGNQFNVKAYGAKGDGTTDERTYVTSALNAAKTVGGGRIVFPKGTYRMGDGTAAGYLTINGSAYNNITLDAEPGAVWLIDSASQNYALLLQNVTGFTIRGFKFSYTTQPTVRDDTGPKCIRVTGATDVLIVDCEVSGSPQYGIGFESCTRPKVVRGRMHDTMADGVNFLNCYAPYADGVHTVSTGDDGIAFAVGVASAAGSRNEGARAVGCSVRYAAGRGVMMLAEGGTITGCTAEDTAGASFACILDYSAADPGLRAKNVTIGGNSSRRAGVALSGTGPNGGTFAAHGATSAGGAITVSSSDGTSFNTTQSHENITIGPNAIEAPGRCGMLLQAIHGLSVSGGTITQTNTSNDATYKSNVLILSCLSVAVDGVVGQNETHAADHVHVESCGTAVNIGYCASSLPHSIATTNPYSLVAADGSFRSVSGVQEIWGAGSPEGVKTAPVGSVYHRNDGGAGTCLYVKESGSGNTGWVAK